MRLDERGKQCPLPVVEAKKALEEAGIGEIVEVVVDNEIAVQNLKKMADHKGYGAESETVGASEFLVRLWKGEDAPVAEESEPMELFSCAPQHTIAVISSNCMGNGDEALGKLLMKSFLYALAGLDEAPETVLFYNSGAFLTCEGSDSIEDLLAMQEKGTKILTCGTCLNHYGLTEKLAVGGVSNMYEIVECMNNATKILRP